MGINPTLKDILTYLSDKFSSYLFAILSAVIIIIIGWYVAKILKKIIIKLMPEKHIDKTVSGFLGEVAYYLVFIIALIAALSKLGVQTTSMAAVLGAGALAIGYSLKDSISQLTSGMILVGMRPFKHGDTIEISGTLGTVSQINLMFTVLITPDNQEVTFPNNTVLNNKIINYSKNKIRRLNISVGVSYDDPIDHVKEVLKKIALEEPKILNTPEPLVAVQNLGDSSVQMLFRAWVRYEDYTEVLFKTTELIKKKFDEKNISIPFPQQEIHITNGTLAPTQTTQ